MEITNNFCFLTMISVFYTVAVFQGGLNVPDSALC